MQRRNFFKFLSIGTAAAAGGAVAAATFVASSGKSDAVKQIEAAGYNGKFTIGSDYGQIAPPDGNTFNIGPKFVPGTKQHVTASMTVGPDGEMYLLTNGKWRKIVTE
jgi:hypothetical protein